MVNVRFYRLETLPSFVLEKHQGIFVHVTSKLTRTIKEGNYTYNWGNLNNNDAIQKIVIQKIDERTIFVPEWMNLRRIDTVESGLWFGGENGWELLSNDTTSGAIDAAIDAKIDALNAGGFTQATIGANPEGSESATGSTLTILGIKEEKGKIKQDDTKNVNIAIDGVYNESNNKIATQSTVTTAINGLNTTETIQAVTKTTETNGNTTLTFNGVKETNGVIAQGDGASTFIVGDAKLKIQIGSNEAGAFDVFSANAQSNGAIKLNENVFEKNGDVISVITPTAVASDNRLVTEKDIANLAGAMHYKGALTGAQSGDGSWPSRVAAGDVYIVTTGFTHSGESNPFEVGDMIVFNADNDNSNYTVVQSNITLGTGDGQIAKNVGALANGNLVVATENGINTTGISATVLGESNNTRDLSYGNVTGGISIKDSLTVLGKDLGKTINITSNNKSIEIAQNGNTGVMVDLVWNTTMENNN